MVTVQASLGFSLCALLILHTHGFPFKGSKSHGQSSSHQGDDFGPQQGSATGRYAPMYSTSRQDRKGQMFGPAPSSPYMFAQSAPAPGGMGFTSEEWVPASAGSVKVGPGYPGFQAEYPVGAVPLVPLPAVYDSGSAQAGGPGSSLPETKWAVYPRIFSEEGLAKSQALDSSTLLSQNPAPSGPVLQSGETSDVVKEAELGNYQRETEEFGYPGAPESGPALQSGETSNVLKQAELGNYQHETEEFGYPSTSQSGPALMSGETSNVMKEAELGNYQRETEEFGYPGAPESGPALQSGETSNVLKEAELGNYQHETEEFGYPSTSQSGPALMSGETSNVLKEAELGKYQHETEEFGYPSAGMGPGQGLPSYPLPYGVFWGSPYIYPASYSSPYPNFDYRLLYGMYPPGTYTTFSKNHEKGKDYYQSIHYLKEHVPETPSTHASGQQKKIFPQKARS
nr:sericin 1 [Nothobranchius furzeri]